MILGMLGVAAIYISIYLLPAYPFFKAYVLNLFNRKD